MQLSRRHKNTDPAGRVPRGASMIGHFRFVQLIAVLGNRIDSDRSSTSAGPASSVRCIGPQITELNLCSISRQNEWRTVAQVTPPLLAQAMSKSTFHCLSFLDFAHSASRNSKFCRLKVHASVSEQT